MKLGDRVRELRGYRDLTLKDLATNAGLSVSYLSDIERGRTTPSLEMLSSLASAFGISVTDLLTGVDFAGEQTDASLPPGLAELVSDPAFTDEIDTSWISLLTKIELRGKRPQSKLEWLELYLALRRILGDA